MLLYVSLLNCFLSLLMLFFNRRKNRNSIFLSFVILFISLYTTAYYFIAFGQSHFWAAIFYANLAPLWYLPGPFLYWYVRGNLEDRLHWRQSDWLHLLPFAISLIGVLPYLIKPFQYKLDTVSALFRDPNIPKFAPPNWLISVEWNLILRPGLVLTYAVFCIGWVVKAQGPISRSSEVAQDQWFFLRNWMILLCGMLIFLSGPSLVLSYFYSVDDHIDFGRINTYSMSYITAYAPTLLSVILLIYPRILYGIPRSTLTVRTATAPNDPISGEAEEHSGYGKSAVKEAELLRQNHGPFEELSQRVLVFMAERKPYLDADFTLEGLAKAMNVPKHHLYYCFQNILHTKFTRLRTEYRIEHAKKLLAEADLTRTTLNVVGKESGFSSTSAFYTAFKVEVGCSPGEYAAGVNPTASGAIDQDNS